MFNELNSIENFIRDILCSSASSQNQVAEARGTYMPGKSQTWRGLGWEYIPPSDLLRQAGDVLVETHLRDALVRLNPEIAEQPDRADEVLYRLRAILLTTLTTVAGLLPLAYGLGGTDLYMQPMALALGYGILLATPLTLVLVPSLYMIGTDIGGLLRNKGNSQSARGV